MKRVDQKEPSEYDKLRVELYAVQLANQGAAVAIEKLLELAREHRLEGVRLEAALDLVVHLCQGALSRNLETSAGYFPKLILEMIHAQGFEVDIPEPKPAEPVEEQP